MKSCIYTYDILHFVQDKAFENIILDDKRLLQYADWFLLKQMSKNVDSETFGNFLESLNKEDNVDDTKDSNDS